jgi:branched-chain amino acid transport system ATP-binding protein
MTALAIENLNGGYRGLTVFRDVSFALKAGDVVGILGPNGAGKTTLLKTITGLLPPQGGRIQFANTEVGNLPAHRRARQGLVLVPEGRQILQCLTVGENLELGRAAGRLDDAAFSARRDEMLALFPRLRERLDQPGGALSGGEQQMLAIARALLLDPTLLMLDEPTQGLAPIMVQQVLAALQSLRGRLAILVVEQNQAFLTHLADRMLSMRSGRIEPIERGVTS